MSVIVKFKSHYFLLTKGADNAVADKAINGSSSKLPSYFSECIDFYLEKGLRVMFMAIKLLSENEVNNFMEQIQNEESEEKL